MLGMITWRVFITGAFWLGEHRVKNFQWWDRNQAPDLTNACGNVGMMGSLVQTLEEYLINPYYRTKFNFEHEVNFLK